MTWAEHYIGPNISILVGNKLYGMYNFRKCLRNGKLVRLDSFRNVFLKH